ncbi:MAG: hypothetical protein FRX48_02281 [Lasallia pustulata]|uniref:Uncharacterized protein n=1 Tax=Lasallia pustulata TaxID=136370 RepID=A0A5M8PXZ7_9LECA|nr:MAG: hypothetical protein FRX48_02281 [Lasallia pustulata]
MNEVQGWLKDIPIEDYTDLQVSALKQYYFFAKLAGSAFSIFDAARYLNLPSTLNATPWYGAPVLRRHLPGVGRLKEAALILVAEDGFAPAHHVILEAYESFLAACTASAPSGTSKELEEGCLQSTTQLWTIACWPYYHYCRPGHLFLSTGTLISEKLTRSLW